MLIATPRDDFLKARPEGPKRADKRRRQPERADKARSAVLTSGGEAEACCNALALQNPAFEAACPVFCLLPQGGCFVAFLDDEGAGARVQTFD